MAFGTKRSVFNNCFTLNIKNNHLQSKYEVEIGEKKIMMLVYIIGMIIVLITGIVQLSKLNLTNVIINDYKDPNGILYFGYACLVPTSVSLILFLFRLKFSQVTYALLFFILVSLFMNAHFFIDYYTLLLDKNFNNYDFIAYSSYFTATISYIIFVDNNFIRIFSANMAIIGMYLVAFTPTIIHYTKIIDLLASYIIRIFLYYFMCRISKISFYYKEKFELQKNWVYDILNHAKCGIIIYNLNKKKVKFFNEYLKKFNQFNINKTIENVIINNNIQNNILSAKDDNSETSDLQNQTALQVNESFGNINDNINGKLFFKYIFIIYLIFTNNFIRQTMSECELL